MNKRNAHSSSSIIIAIISSIITCVCVIATCSLSNDQASNIANMVGTLIPTTGTLMGTSAEPKVEPVEYVTVKSIPAGNETMPTPWYRGKLNDSEKSVYDELENGMRSLSKDIKVDGVSVDRLTTLYEYVMYDNPDIFWLSDTYTYTQSGNQSVVSVQPAYSIDSQSRITELQHRIDDSTDKALASLPESGSDYDKLKAIYTWLCDNVEYDESAEFNQNIVSSLVNGKSACAGYSRAMQYICGKAGIPCIYVTGPATSSNGTVLHAWNAACINGTVTYLDATWGDRDGQAPTDYSWLGLTLSDIAKTHSANDPSIIPSADNASYEIWSIAGGDFGTYNSETLYSRLASGVAAHEECTCLRFGSEDDASSAYTALTSGSAIAGRLVAQFGGTFSNPTTNGVYSVYKDEGLTALVVVWRY